jgi:2,4-dienoyl-CoA reductase (NADPH2)
VKLKLEHRVSAQELLKGGYTHIVLATGVTPRTPAIEGIDHPKVVGYLDVLRDKCAVGRTVALIGAGGIGFDVAEFLLHSGTSPSLDPTKFFAEWGVDTSYSTRGGLTAPHIEKNPRKVYLLQRKTSKVGDGLGKTTGWIHRTSLKNRQVEMLAGVTYRKVDDAGLHITVGEREMTIPADTVVVCAGQDPQRELQAELVAAGCSVHLIGQTRHQTGHRTGRGPGRRQRRRRQSTCRKTADRHAARRGRFTEKMAQHGDTGRPE